MELFSTCSAGYGGFRSLLHRECSSWFVLSSKPKALRTRRSVAIKTTRRVPNTNIYSMAGNVSETRLDARRESVIERIHSTQTKLVLYVTGGGMQTSSWLLSVPGASRTVLDVRVPYCEESLNELLPHTDTSTGSASAPTAVAMAKAAYKKATCLTRFGTPVMGVGVTCALATDRQRRGEDKIFVSIYGPRRISAYSLILEKATRSRLQEDTIASELALGAISSATGVSELPIEVDEYFKNHILGPNDELEVQHRNLVPDDISGAIRLLLNGAVETLEFSGGFVFADAPRTKRLYLPGSFNPLHDGHIEMLEAARRIRPKKEAAFELSIGNADKGLLSQTEIERRVQRFIDLNLPIVLTQAPLFTMKADLFPGSTFIVGYDTATRLIQERYYGSETAMLLQFAKFANQKCDFLVAGRVNKEGKFCTLNDIQIPDMLQRGSLFAPIPTDEFRNDISSTELREQQR